MRHPSYAEGNSPVQQNSTGAKKHKFGQETTQKKIEFSSPKGMMHFFWTGVMMGAALQCVIHHMRKEAAPCSRILQVQKKAQIWSGDHAEQK